jgi:hypothetical protein
MRPKHLRTPSATRKAARAVTVPLVLAAVVAGAAAPAFAGKYDRAGASSLAVVVKDGPDALPNHGETITFAVTSPVEKKWVDLYCYQGGEYVYSQTAGFFPDYPWAPDYGLSSAYWTSGSADCSATLYTLSAKGRRSVLSTLSFAVAA